MKFEISTKALKKALSVVSHATAGITTTPILENILIKVNYKHIVLTANNLEMAIEYMVDDAKIISEGAFSVPSKLFSSYVGLLQDDMVQIELSWKDALEIKTDSGKTKIKGIAAEDFPVIPSVKEELSLSLKGHVVRKSIEKTLFSSAEGNIRPTLAGLFVNISGSETIFASTDSFRLSEYKTVLDAPSNVSFSQIIPGKTCNEIKKYYLRWWCCENYFMRKSNCIFLWKYQDLFTTPQWKIPWLFKFFPELIYHKMSH